MEDIMTSLQEAKRNFVTFEQMASHRARRGSDEFPLVPIRPHEVVEAGRSKPSPRPGPIMRDAAPRAVLSLPPEATGRPPVRNQNLSRHNSLKSILNQLAEFEQCLADELLSSQNKHEAASSVEGYTLPFGDPFGDPVKEEISVYHRNEVVALPKSALPSPPPLPPKPNLGAIPKKTKSGRKDTKVIEKAHLAMVIPKRDDSLL